jgi:transcriptional regulator with XRE-family HTH domain
VRLAARQISAAMALAGMNQDELASAAGIARPSLNKILSDSVVAKDDTLNKIRRALESRNIEFIGNSGVQWAQQRVRTLTGPDGLKAFFDDVYDHSRREGGLIVQFGVDEQKFLTHLGSEFSQSYMGRMAEVARERKDLTVRAIICEGDMNFLAAEYNEYRWISKEVFQAVPFYIYGKTLAIMDFQTVPAPTIVILTFPAITNAYRAQFEAFWRIAQEPAQAPKLQSPSKAKRK